ncbi:MAG TPA: XRE family transcriptional regulator [Conexibacter sp.]|nr:XRE family transcriptional regulator [Conexibacter sp.]
MTQDTPLEETLRTRLRALRHARDWSLDELASRTHISPSTLSRLETGRRRMAIDQVVTLARALGTTVDELLAEKDDANVVIRPRRDNVGDATFWLFTDPEDASGRVVAKLRMPHRARLPQARVHPGRDWLYVLRGTLRLRLGSRDVLVRAGQAASFDTMTPHSMGGHDGPVEILSILDHHGERAHLQD